MCRVMFYYGSRYLYEWCSNLTFFFFVVHGVLAWRGGEAGGGGREETWGNKKVVELPPNCPGRPR